MIKLQRNVPEICFSRSLTRVVLFASSGFPLSFLEASNISWNIFILKILACAHMHNRCTQKTREWSTLKTVRVLVCVQSIHFLIKRHAVSIRPSSDGLWPQEIVLIFNRNLHYSNRPTPNSCLPFILSFMREESKIMLWNLCKFW